MTQFFRDKQDYAFGQAMLTLRTRIGLTQEDLGELLSVSRKTLSRWEAGSSYPSADHLQTLRRDRPYERLNITGIRGLSDAQKASLRALGALEETSSEK